MYVDLGRKSDERACGLVFGHFHTMKSRGVHERVHKWFVDDVGLPGLTNCSGPPFFGIDILHTGRPAPLPFQLERGIAQGSSFYVWSEAELVKESK